MMPRLTHALRSVAAVLFSMALAACGGGATSDSTPKAAEDGRATASSALVSSDSVQVIQSALITSEGSSTDLVVRAYGTLAGNVGPLMTVLVNGATIGSVEVRATEPADYSFKAPQLKQGSKVDVVFTNDAVIAGADRNLHVVQVSSANTAVLSTASGVTFDRGDGNAAFDGIDVTPSYGGLYSNGALRLVWPATNLTSRLTVRASGTLAADTGPKMTVRVDGIVVGTVEVRSPTPADHAFAVPPLKVGSKIDVAFTNADPASAPARRLQIAYLMAGTTVVRPDSSTSSIDLGSGLAAFDGQNMASGQGTLTASGALRAIWPASNMVDTLTIRASGSLAGDVGPVMEVRVDDIVIGTVEVRSTTPTDINLPMLPIRPGAKVDIAYVNHAVVGSQVRQLTVDYAISGKTFLSPAASGTVFDTGSGQAAFDGQNVVAGRNTLTADGALRATWPQPNINDTVTVRASATLAGNVGAQMVLWVDGMAVSSVEVRSTEAADYVMPTTPLKPGSKVAIVFSNPGTVSGIQRQLNVQYLIAESTFLSPTSTGTSSSKGEFAGAWPKPNLTDKLVVRAYADVAGGIGAIMQVRVNGVIVATTEITATSPTDHEVPIPPLSPSDKVDFVYINDGRVDGVDRNLYVLQARSGNTALQASSPGVVIDRGVGEAAFDGADVLPGHRGLYWPAALRTVWPEANLTNKLTVRASATQAGGVGALMIVRVDGLVVGTSEVKSAEPADFSFDTPPLSAGSRVDVAFANAGTVGTTVRNLRVHYIMSGQTTLMPNDPGVVFDKGSDLAAFDNLDTRAGDSLLQENGAIRGAWPASNMTDVLTVRAGGRVAGGVGPVMQVRVDGVVLGTVEVRSSTPVDYALPTKPLRAGAQLDIIYTNEAVVGTERRELNVAYAISGKTTLRPDAAGVVYDLGSGLAALDGVNTIAGRSTLTANGALRAAWPAPNLVDKLTVRARADLAGGVGPTLQVIVDGIMVGAVEVKSTVHADYQFAVPAMSVGRKLDLVYANATSSPGEDQNLYIAYATTQDTVLLPNAAGGIYDRGPGAEAFDGRDTIPAWGYMYWAGALRMTWPAPNITDTVTVRASATLAGNVGPLMVLWVDGVAVSSTEVRSTVLADYRLPTTPLKAGSKVVVAFANRGSVDGVERKLNLQYLLAGTTLMTPTSAGVVYTNGDLVGVWPNPSFTDTLTVRAYADVAGGVGAIMQLRVNGVIVATKEVTATTPTDYVFQVPKISAGTVVDVLYTNDGRVNGVDRNLYVLYVRTQGTTVVPFTSNVQLYSGDGEAALQGQSISAGTTALYGPGALRFTIPTNVQASTDTARASASRFLQLATFGPTIATIDRVAQIGEENWINEQIALPFAPDMVQYVQAKYDLGSNYRPGGSAYNPQWVTERFWAAAAKSPDQLRRRMGFALHHILMISQADSNLFYHARGYAQYVDTLNRHALGNYRDLLEEIALSPMMGIYLSHMRNRPESLGTGRMPDENLAREVMQLFSIGLHELNADGTPKLDSRGQPIETYTNDDVMAMAKVFTGWSWALPDSELSEYNFRWWSPDIRGNNDLRVDVQRMKAYPGQHSTIEKRLFNGKSWATTLPAGNTAQADLKAALDALFNHPNVGPFLSRQLIQRLVASNPSPAYVARVAAVFNNNGRGVRGDLAAVARAILRDPEVATPPASNIGKLREPVLRTTQWMRALDAVSASGSYPLHYDLDTLGQRQLGAPSVFGYFRPGYVPPNSALSLTGITAPELQIVDETTSVQWLNTALRMAEGGLGWTGAANDVVADLSPLVSLLSQGQVDAAIERLNLLLLGGRMSATLRQDIYDALVSISANTASSHTNRARLAVFLVLSSTEFLVIH